MVCKDVSDDYKRQILIYLGTLDSILPSETLLFDHCIKHVGVGISKKPEKINISNRESLSSNRIFYFPAIESVTCWLGSLKA